MLFPNGNTNIYNNSGDRVDRPCPSSASLFFKRHLLADATSVEVVCRLILSVKRDNNGPNIFSLSPTVSNT